MVSMNNDTPDVTITATRKKRRGEKEESMPERVESGRQLEAYDVEAYAINKGILDNCILTSPFRRTLPSFTPLGSQESVDAASKRGIGWTLATSTTRRELVHQPKDETTGRADFPLPALIPQGEEEEDPRGSPTVAATQDRQMLTELRVPEIPEGREYILRASVSHSFKDIITGDSRVRGDDSDSRISHIVHRIPTSDENAARNSKCSVLWSSQAGPSQSRRDILPGGVITASGAPTPVSSEHVNGTESLGPWNTRPNGEVEVLVWRSQAIQPRKSQSVNTSERSPVSSPRRDSQRIPRKIPESSSTLGVPVINTLYDSLPQESHDPSPRPPKFAEPDLCLDVKINIPPTPENIYDRPPVTTDNGQEILKRAFDVPVTTEPEIEVDTERIFYIPDVPQRDTTTVIPVSPTGDRSPAQSRGGSRLSSPKTSLAGTTTPSTTGTSGSSSTDYTKDSESRRDKRTPHWR